MIEKTKTPRVKPELNDKLPFGRYLADHLLEINWTAEAGWDLPRIKPYGPFIMDPSTSVLNFAIECFEGMKAYKNAKSEVLLFRPLRNMERMRSSGKALCLPDYDPEEFLLCIVELLKLDRDWVPQKEGFSLYLRPTFIGDSDMFELGRPQAAKLFVINSPVGPYYPTGFKPVALYCDNTAARAYPGGMGHYKLGGNYAAGIKHSERIAKLGYQQMLWLIDDNVTEVGTMNFFVRWRNENGVEELITAPLDGTILPGVTRESILSLVRGWGEILVSEKKFSITDLVKASEERRLIECFGCGTAAVVSPVEKFFYNGKDYTVPLALGNSGELTKRLWDKLIAIQYGITKHPWCYVID